MPPRKKPAPKKSSRPRPAATAKKTASRKTPARKTAAARSRAAVRKPVASRSRKPARRTPRRPVEESVQRREAVEEEGPVLGRPVAVGSAPRPLWEENAAPLRSEPLTPPAYEIAPPSAPTVTRPMAEMVVAASSLLLAASVFLPWYHLGLRTVSGWSSGTWGPIIFFLALASVALIGLRRARIAVALPVEPTLAVEAIGWVAVVGLILKRYLPPKVGFSLPTDGWIFASLVLALALAVLAGVASSDAPFVYRPGWFAGRAGKLGAGILVVAIAGGVALGLTNEAVPTASPVPRVSPGARVEGLPSCAAKLKFPVPAGFTPTVGVDTTDLNSGACYALFSTRLSLTTAYNRYVNALRTSGFTLYPGRARKDTRTLGFRGDSCGSVNFASINKSVSATAIVTRLNCSVAPQ